MDSKRLNELCRKGEKADSHLREGKARDALKMYNEILSDLEKKDEVDSYLAAKVTMGSLRCYLKLGDFKNAFAIWNSNMEDSLFGIGIYALESAQTTVEDMVTYDMICAFLHTLADSDKADAATAVNQYLSRVCEHAVEQGNRSLMAMALNNWKHHLREIFSTSIPHEYAKSLINYEKSLGHATGENSKSKPIDFPFAASWERPSDFHEMSRVILMKSKKAPQKKEAPHPKKKKSAS